RGVNNGGTLRGSIEHGDVAVLAGVAIEHVHDLAADATERFLLSSVHIFLKILLLALKLLGQCFTLTSQTLCLFGTQFVAARLQALAQIVDLLVHRFDFVLARRKLRLQFGGCLLAFGRVHDCLANAQHTDLGRGGPGSSCGRALRPGRKSSNQGSGQKSRCSVHLIHCSLLILLDAVRPPWAKLAFGQTCLPLPCRVSRGIYKRESIAEHPCSRNGKARAPLRPRTNESLRTPMPLHLDSVVRKPAPRNLSLASGTEARDCEPGPRLRPCSKTGQSPPDSS